MRHLPFLGTAKPISFSRENYWTLALCAGLLGIGQNGLLVALPILVSETKLSLSVWAGLLTLGSILFLPASPWWGRRIDRYGCKPVVVASLCEYLLSFMLLALACLGMVQEWLSVTVGLCGLIVARIIYGLTVSGMVPACQVWALQRAGPDHRMRALAAISSGLSGGRLFGPLCASAALVLHPLAPLWLMALTPLLALLIIWREQGEPPQISPARLPVRLRANMLLYLCCALCLAAAVSLMQLGLSPALKMRFPAHGESLSHQVALLLSLAAITALLAQFTVLRRQLLSPGALLILSGGVITLGLTLMVWGGVALFYLGCGIMSFGAALAKPSYQILLNDRLQAGAGAGWIATSHTLGYGLSACLVPLVTMWRGEDALIAGALVMTLIFCVMSGEIWRQQRVRK
ncbi:putative MFS family arabinose efflux permease|uniref:Putative MFS family arabinose efflux permease n=1 Tax=Brenneria salicis ATCC 15712 = DSM 30166 TaxID=714314 RepID=A0A366ICC8_9GAMM|nr:MFS transporter [Brenneria salicis]NMN90578.1 putative MFS family arabinose efflux permease [Brenneria salicis ATCC 15712 = DSM 30166]RBP66929.1 putative MFS family arabinose efflux permease [Brenneria salicis ATCC 15712 = DSM 30166]RLM32099.1 MFS transporter [Brenneria salicis ATCC 15712 = DSM 30166]